MDIDYRVWTGETMQPWLEHIGHDAGYLKYLVKSGGLMQYTGVIDTQGIKIFEKDVVKFKLFGVEYTAVILFDAGGFGPLYRGEILTMSIPLEVVGNLYENPKAHYNTLANADHNNWKTRGGS